MPEIGTRIVAMKSGDDEHIYVFGHGVYEGIFPPPPYLMTSIGPVMANNPRIKLDNGEVVWGAECWWGSEDGWEDNLKDWAPRTVVEVSVEDYRNNEKESLENWKIKNPVDYANYVEYRKRQGWDE